MNAPVKEGDRILVTFRFPTVRVAAKEGPRERFFTHGPLTVPMTVAEVSPSERFFVAVGWFGKRREILYIDREDRRVTYRREGAA